MPDQTNTSHDDSWIINWFKDFDNLPPIDKQTVDWSILTDFQVYKEYLINDVQDIKDRLDSADNKYLYYVCEHLFNVLDWINLMVFDAGYPTFVTYIEDELEKHYGDRKILQNLYDTCLEKWISQNSEQQKIGGNFYNILAGKIYYRNHKDQWFEIDKKTAFDLNPSKKLISESELIDELDKDYYPTRYDLVFQQWKNKQYQGVLPDDFLEFEDKDTSPEKYFALAFEHIKTLLKDPISITELQRWNGEEIEDLDYIIKLSTLILDTVKKRRADDCHTVYLLRDCLTFYETHKTLDLLDSKETSVDQIMIGRKLLSNGSNEWGYYIATLEALYAAHMRYPNNFDDFYNEYARLLDIFASLNKGFREILSNLSEYIRNHIHTNKNRIVIFDIGFQGSINLLTKYIIDRHITSDKEIDINIEVGAQWSKKLYGKRYNGDYFPYLNRVQLITRNNDLYYYKTGSLNSGKLQVLMGTKENQYKATVELIVLMMIICLMHEDSNLNPS